MGGLNLELEREPFSNLSFRECSLPEFPVERGGGKFEDEGS